MGNEFAPAGAVQYFARETAPEGWLVADGREVSRTQYPDLFKAIRVKFGMGDGIDTFNLPDLRGEFIRGLDAGRGLDGGRRFGSTQESGLVEHSHYVFGSGIRQDLSESNYPREYAAVGEGGLVNENFEYIMKGTVNAPTKGRTSLTGISENRPRNIALLVCIKY